MRPHGRFAFWSVWAVFALGFLICRWTLFDPVFYNVDEAEYSVGALALAQGKLPGLDLVGSTKPPAIVFLYSALFAVTGPSLLAVQMLGFLLWLILLALVMLLARRITPEAPLWVSALIFLLLANSFGPPRDLHALNVELPGIVLVCVAYLLMWKTAAARRLVLGGVLIGIAVMFRQSLILFALPLLSVVESPRLRSLALIAFGAILPWIVLLIPYALRDGLGWAYDSWVRFPALYAADVGFSGFLVAAWFTMIDILRQSFVPWAFALAGLFFAMARRNTFLLLCTVSSLLAVSSGSRFFEHYFIQALPTLALLGAIAMAEMLSKSEAVAKVTKAVLALGVVMALLHFPLWRYWDSSAPPPGISAESLDLFGLETELARFAQQETIPGESVFVWGYGPQIYFHANRLPAVRDFLCEYVTGYSPFSTNPRPYARPDALTMMLGDLEKNKPKVIFDLSFVDAYQYSFSDYPLTRYPDLANYVRTNYRPSAQVGQVAVYQRVSD